MKRIFHIILLLLMLSITGCAMDDLARKDDVQNIQSNVSEELLKVKTQSDEVKWQVDEANKKAADLEKELSALKSQIIENNKVIDRKITELNAAMASLDAKTAKTEEELIKKMGIILEEVSKENQRILTKLENKGSKAKKEKSNQPSEKSDVHVVREGENLTKIAKTYGISVNQLMEANNLENPNNMRVGQKLKIPKKSADKTE